MILWNAPINSWQITFEYLLRWEEKVVRRTRKEQRKWDSSEIWPRLWKYTRNCDRIYVIGWDINAKEKNENGTSFVRQTTESYGEQCRPRYRGMENNSNESESNPERKHINDAHMDETNIENEKRNDVKAQRERGRLCVCVHKNANPIERKGA